MLGTNPFLSAFNFAHIHSQPLVGPSSLVLKGSGVSVFVVVVAAAVIVVVVGGGGGGVVVVVVVTPTSLFVRPQVFHDWWGGM